jgi:hypothetical protein
MKIIVTSLLFVCCAFLLSFKNHIKSTNLPIVTQLCLNEDEEEFVELMDGKIIKGNVTKCNVFKSNSFKSKGSGHVVIDDVKYEYKDVMAVQFKKNRFKKNAAGEFAKRTYKSKISVYYTWIDIGGAGRTQEFYYILKGDQGSLVDLSIINLRIMAKDCLPAIAVLDKHEKLSKREQTNKSISVLYECIDVYNVN